MNIAYFLLPKSRVAYLYDDYSVRQGLEKMHYHGYSAIPVISRDGKYVGTITEGDFLWHLLSGQENGMAAQSLKDLERMQVQELLSLENNPPVRITVSMEELMDNAMNHNFVPVVDDLGSFTGIVTRKDILRYYTNKTDSAEPRQLLKIV